MKANLPKSLSEALTFSSEKRILQFIKENPLININKREEKESSNCFAKYAALGDKKS